MPGISLHTMFSETTRTWRIMALISVVLLVGVYARFAVEYLSTVDGLFDADGLPIGRDYVNVWTAARMVLSGGIAELSDPNRFHAAQEQLLGRAFPMHNWSYPPHLIPFLLCFGLVPYLWGFFAWSGVTFAAYAAAALARQSRKAQIFALLLLAPSTFVNFTGGQNGFLTSALLIGGLRLMDRQPVWAGILFGCLTIKPQLGLLVPIALIAAGAWRAILSAAVTAAVLVGISVALFGIEPWLAYVSQVAPFQRAILEYGEGYFTLMMPTPFMAARLMGWDIAAGYWLNAASALATAAIVYWTFRHKTLPNALRGTIFLVATLLATPYAFNYDMPALSAALAVLLTFQMSDRLRPGELLVLVATWTLPQSVLIMNSKGLPLGPVILAAMLVYLLLRARTLDPQAGAQAVGPD